MADIRYVKTSAGWCDTAFVTDAYSRMIKGWAVSRSMDTVSLPLPALKQAISNAKQDTTIGLEILIHHADHGSQYVSARYGQVLSRYWMASSTGSVGDFYDNALAESVNSAYKNELVHNQHVNTGGFFKDENELEVATFEWVTW